MATKYAAYGHRTKKGAEIILHHLILQGQRDPSCMFECLGVYMENTPGVNKQKSSTLRYIN